jgi:hypothetical protein
MADGDQLGEVVISILLHANRATLTPTQLQQLTTFFRVAPGAIG